MEIRLGPFPAPSSPQRCLPPPTTLLPLPQVTLHWPEAHQAVDCCQEREQALKGLGKVRAPERESWVTWALPEMIHLVEHIDVVRDLLPAQEAVHVGHEDQELLEALAEGYQHRQAVGAPRRVFFPVFRGWLWGAGPGWAWGLLPLSPSCPGHVTRAAELQPEQGEEAQ